MEENPSEPPSPSETDHHTLSESHLSQHNLRHAKHRTPIEWIVVRIEVTDTGCGIKPKDIAQSKLFCKVVFLCLGCGRKLTESISSFQSDRVRATARFGTHLIVSSVCSPICRWQRYRAWTCARAVNCQTQWWTFGCPFETRRGIHILGRIT